MNISYNKLICETYKSDRIIRTTVNKAFATVEQKSTLVGLKVLVNAKLANGDMVLAGSKVYIKEKNLRDSPVFKDSYECDALQEKFLMVDVAHIEFIVPQIEEQS